jgi:hypothetical protein
MATAHGGYDSERDVSDEWEVSEWMTTAETFNDLGFTFHGGPTEAQQERAATLDQVHTGLHRFHPCLIHLSPLAIETIHTEFTAAATILLRFARHRCLHRQHRSDTCRTIKANQLIQQLTTGLKRANERVSAISWQWQCRQNEQRKT